jgi:CBS domain-containing protein
MMKVDSILTPAVVRIERSASLAEAAGLMRDRHVGALLVTDDAPHTQRFVGIVTDRDIVLKGVAQNLTPSRASVSQVMTSGTIDVPLGTALTEALGRMRSRGVRRLLVMHADGRIAGIVSLDNIVDTLGHEFAGMAGILRSELEREMVRTAPGTA